MPDPFPPQAVTSSTHGPTFPPLPQTQAEIENLQWDFKPTLVTLWMMQPIPGIVKDV